MISFFFQAEDGIRDGHVTGVQTCALPIFFTGTLHMTEYAMSGSSNLKYGICKNPWNLDYFPGGSSTGSGAALAADMVIGRSEERRVGKECRSRWWWCWCWTQL